MGVNNCSLVSEEYAVFNKTKNSSCVQINNENYNMNMAPGINPNMKSTLFNGMCMVFDLPENLQQTCHNLWAEIDQDGDQKLQTCFGKLLVLAAGTVKNSHGKMRFVTAEDFVKTFPIFWECKKPNTDESDIDLFVGNPKKIVCWSDPQKGAPKFRVVCQDNGLLNLVMSYPQTRVHNLFPADPSTLKFYHTFSVIDIDASTSTYFASPYGDYTGTVTVQQETTEQPLGTKLNLTKHTFTINYKQKNWYKRLHDSIVTDGKNTSVVMLESNGKLSVSTSDTTVESTNIIFDGSNNQAVIDGAGIKTLFAYPLHRDAMGGPILKGLQWWFSNKDARYLLVHDADSTQFTIRPNPFVLPIFKSFIDGNNDKNQTAKNLFQTFCKLNTYSDADFDFIMGKLDSTSQIQFKREHPYKYLPALCSCSEVDIPDSTIASYFWKPGTSPNVQTILTTEAGMYPRCLHACRDYYKDDYGAVNKTRPENVPSDNYTTITSGLNCPSTIVICNAEVQAADQGTIYTQGGINISQNCKSQITNVLLESNHMCTSAKNGDPCNIQTTDDKGESTAYVGFECFEKHCRPKCMPNENLTTSMCGSGQVCQLAHQTPLSSGVCVDGSYVYDKQTNKCSVTSNPSPSTKTYNSLADCQSEHPTAKPDIKSVQTEVGSTRTVIKVCVIVMLFLYGVYLLSRFLFFDN